MPLDKHDVWVGSPNQSTVGPVLSAPLGKVTKPKSVDDHNEEAYTDSGYISKNGLKVSINKSFTEIKDWSLTTVRKLLSEYSGQISWSHISMDEQAWKNFAGENNVTAKPASESSGATLEIKFNPDEPVRKSWKFKIKDGSRKLVIFVPDGQVQGDGDLELKADAEIGLPVILTTFPDKDGNHFYILTDDGKVSVKEEIA